MSNRCPKCHDKYDRMIRGKKATIPRDAEACHRSVQLANGESIGKWYIHES